MFILKVYSLSKIANGKRDRSWHDQLLSAPESRHKMRRYSLDDDRDMFSGSGSCSEEKRGMQEGAGDVKK